MTGRTQDNVVLIHWHDLGRYLGVYGHRGVSSPRLDALASEGILFTRAHATAPLCSPSRGSFFTGRYPHSNGLVGLAHHGWEYRPGVRTLPAILSQFGWHTALFGMQHETSFPARLGFDEFDVSNSYCDYVAEKSTDWLRGRHPEPFLLTAGFFETHRPYPPERYSPAAVDSLDVPSYLPDTPQVRLDLAEFYGSIAAADAAVGDILDTVAETGLDRNTWVVFVTDHGAAFPRAKSTLYDAGTGIALIVRPPRDVEFGPRVYDELFSGVDLLPTLLGFLGLEAPEEVEGISHADLLMTSTTAGTAREEVFTSKTYHDSFDPIRAVRTKDYSYIENYAQGPRLDLPWDIADSPTGRAMPSSIDERRPARELYDLRADPDETVNLLEAASVLETAGNEQDVEGIAEDLALRLNDWREATGDVVPSEFVGRRIADRYTDDFIKIHGSKPITRSALSRDRGIEDARDS